MTDRELLESLRQQHAEIKHALMQVGGQLHALEARLAPAPPPVTPPPPVPAHRDLPPVPVSSPALPQIPAALPPVPPTRHSLEFRFSRWLTRLGALLGVVTLVLVLSLAQSHLLAWLGPAGVIGLSGAISLGVIILAQRMQQQRFFAHTLLALGLAGFYVTLYAAHAFDPVRVIRSSVLGGALLVFWSIYVFLLAERRKSQGLAIFAVVLAYFSTAINPVGRFSLAADLMLAGVAVVFLLRRGWPAISYLALFGTYFALFRRLIVDSNGQYVFETRSMPFAPCAVYLLGAWAIFTAAILLSTQRTFRGGNRLAFLSLNNGALVFLMLSSGYLADYGWRSLGWMLIWLGLLLLGTALLAGGRRPDPGFGQVAGAYLGQGLAVLTAGLMSVFIGLTRAIVLAAETFVLGLGGTLSGGGIVRVAAMVAAFFAALFLGWEANGTHPWLCGLGGAAVMLLNAWWSRHNVRPSPLGRRGLVPAASYYCVLAVALIATALNSYLSDAALPPAFAAVALGLSVIVYLVPLYELPPVAQSLLIAAQCLVLFPVETGENLPRSSTIWVVVLTLAMLAWWSRQRAMRCGPWLTLLNFVYALALVGLADRAVRPSLDHQSWMIASSLLSVGFLAFGAFTRVWPLAIMGQVFLAEAVYRFYVPGDLWYPFPWTWWAASIPVATVFATGRAIHAWQRSGPATNSDLPLRLLGYGYLLLAVAMLTRLIFGVVTISAQEGVFISLGTLILALNTRRMQPFGVRCSFIFTLIGLWLFLGQLNQVGTAPLEALVFLSLLTQPILLRHAPRLVVTRTESWLLVLVASAAGWLFVHTWIISWLRPNDLTLGWALYALLLFFLGLVGWERRLRWCGLVILFAAVARVAFVDFWGLSTGLRALTFAVLTIIALGLGYLGTRYHERLKTWL